MIKNLYNGITGDETIEELRIHNEGLLTELDAMLKMMGTDYSGKALRSNFVDVRKSLKKNEFNSDSDDWFNDDIQIQQYSPELQSMLHRLKNLYIESVNLSIEIWKQKIKESK